LRAFGEGAYPSMVSGDLAPNEEGAMGATLAKLMDGLGVWEFRA
jgi:hypothetical protein